MYTKKFTFEKRDVPKRASYLLKNGTKIFVPLCPDYVSENISDGVSDLMLTSLEVVQEIQIKFPKNEFIFLIADTEGDLFDSFNRAGIISSKEKFHALVKEKSINGTVSLFLDEFPDWHAHQYHFEKLIVEYLQRSDGKTLENYLDSFYQQRLNKYRVVYGDRTAESICRKIQIRHYAQYVLLSQIMISRGHYILLNYLTENLRAVTKYHSFLPETRKVELIVY